MKIVRFYLIFQVFLSAIVANAQIENPTDDNLFREFEITEIRVTMTAGNKTTLLAEENRYANIYVPADLVIMNSQLNNVEVLNVGVRLRGNTARQHDKRSFKIDFREYGGLKFEGHKKINLKPNVNDPTMVRELLSMHLYRKMGVPALCLAPAALYINEEFMGTYLIAEQVDDEFVDRRFGHEEGFLYKCSYGASLTNNGQVYNETMFESEINEEFDTRAELNAFVTTLNNTTSIGMTSVLPDYFDVDTYLRQLAVESMIGHWDGYSYNKNNFYLYYDGQTGLMNFIPYDTDNTWGIDWIGGNWGTYNVESFYHPSDSRPLTKKLLSVPAYKEAYIRNIGILLQAYFNPTYLHPIFDQLESLFGPKVQQDTYFDDAFDFSYSFFQSSFDNGTSQHVKYGLRSFLSTRVNTTTDYVLSVSDNSAVSIYPNPSSDPTFVLSSLLGEDMNLAIFDINGKRARFNVERIGLNDWRITLNVQSPGLYLIKHNEDVIKWMYR
jgi:spore coat protein H